MRNRRLCGFIPTGVDVQNAPLLLEKLPNGIESAFWMGWLADGLPGLCVLCQNMLSNSQVAA